MESASGLASLGINFQAIIIYLVNFGLLLGVLTYLLYRPVLNFVDQRRQHIKAQITEAEKIKSEFQARLKEMEAEKTRVQAELTQELEQMRGLIQTERSKMVADMQAERDQLMAKANKDIENRKDQLVKEVESDLLEVITKVVLTVVHNKVPADVVKDSVAEAWSNFKK